jgi:hypothetical protein
VRKRPVDVNRNGIGLIAAHRSNRLQFSLCALALAVAPLSVVLSASNHLNPSGHLRVARYATLPPSIRAFALEGTISSGATESKLWFAFSGLSASPSVTCVEITNTCGGTKPTAGSLVVISTSYGRVLATSALGTLPDLSAAGRYVWIATFPSFPASEMHDMGRIPAIGGGWVRELAAATGAVVASYKIPLAQAVQPYGANAFVVASQAGDFYGRSQLLEVGHGVVRSLLRGILGIPTSPQPTVVCGGSLGLLTTDQLQDGSRTTLTVESLAGTEHEEIDVSRFGAQELLSCFNDHILLASVGPWRGRAGQVEALVAYHPARFTPVFRASVIAWAKASRSIWLAAMTGRGRYAIEEYASQGLSTFSNVPTANGLLPTRGSMLASGGAVYFLLGNDVYKVSSISPPA